jgi:molecular chaperone DnaK (HSP70)
MNENLHRVIGIDLGTTYSAVAAHNKYTTIAEIIHDANAQTTPSVVSLDPITRKVIVGKVAKQNLPADPLNTIIEIKREMGEVFRPENREKFSVRWDEGKPVTVLLDGQPFQPQEISAFILMKMKSIAERELGEEIRDAVITVPAYFTEKQKKATEEAARLAGLYPRQLLPEPTAAAICYGVDTMEPTRRVYLVYDLGGGTFDVSIITVEENKIDVITTSGDPRLGGGDFDDVITDWAVEELRLKYQLDVANNPSARAIIKLQAETTKIALSTFPEAEMSLLSLRPQSPPRLVLSRAKFEELIEPLLNKSLTFVARAITQAAEKGYKQDDIDAILLVGGSSKIPRVKSLLLDYFHKDESFLRVDLDPDAVVARGAAIMAQRFVPSPPPYDITRSPAGSLVNMDADQEIYVGLITEHSLGVGVQNNLFSKIIDQGTSLPCSGKDDYTNEGPSEHVEVHVYQGEGQYVYENTLIGTLPLGPMTPLPKNSHKFEVTFTLDVNGLLSMMVNHINEGRIYQATFDQKTGIAGGLQGMKYVREKLLKMVAPSVLQTVSPPDGPPVPPGGYTTPPSSAEPVPPTATSRPQDESQPASVAAEPVPEGNRPIPEQYQSLVRRVEKQLIAQPNPRLRMALDAFQRAVNEGANATDLQDTKEDLDDVYQRCKFPTS